MFSLLPFSSALCVCHLAKTTFNLQSKLTRISLRPLKVFCCPEDRGQLVAPQEALKERSCWHFPLACPVGSDFIDDLSSPQDLCTSPFSLESHLPSFSAVYALLPRFGSKACLPSGAFYSPGHRIRPFSLPFPKDPQLGPSCCLPVSSVHPLCHEVCEAQGPGLSRHPDVEHRAAIQSCLGEDEVKTVGEEERAL